MTAGSGAEHRQHQRRRKGSSIISSAAAFHTAFDPKREISRDRDSHKKPRARRDRWSARCPDGSVGVVEKYPFPARRRTDFDPTAHQLADSWNFFTRAAN